MSKSITSEETEKLKELVKAVKNIEAVNTETRASGGMQIQDEHLQRAKRAVTSYQKYLAEKYGGDPASFTVSDEKEVKTEESEPEPEPTKVTGTFEGTTTDTSKTKSPDVAKF